MAYSVIDNENYAFAEGMSKEDMQENLTGMILENIPTKMYSLNLNDLTTCGIYAVPRSNQASDNQPPYNSGYASWIVLVMKESAASKILQLAFAYGATIDAPASGFYIRWQFGTGWSNWQKM